MDAAVRTFGLTKRYGDTLALDGLELSVPVGVVFGYLGPNGAGKTTTIRQLVGLLRPTAGRAEVLGLDVVTEREQVLRRVGYLPGDFAADRGLTGEQYLRYLANLRGGVSWERVTQLMKRLDLDGSRRIGTLSHGNKQKIGLVQAFMHDPDLLILDEPTSGLDPLIQREFLGLVREARDAGHTVFLSSHVLDEVEHVADVVAILRGGRLVVVETVEALKARAMHRLELSFAGVPPVAALQAAPGVQEVHVEDGFVQVVVSGSSAELLRVAAPYGVERVVSRDADLEEIFLTYYAEEA